MVLQAVIFSVTLLATVPALAQPVRDQNARLIARSSFDRSRLLGDWYEVAQTPTFLERDCHGTTVNIEEREDSRLTMQISCHVGAIDGPILPIDGIMVESAPGIFLVRLIRLPHLGNLPLIVIWESEDASMLALGAPRGEIGWIWARSAHPDLAGFDKARQALVAQGYRASAIQAVQHAP